MFLTVVDRFWPFLTVLTVFDQSWSFLTVFDHIWLFTIVACFDLKKKQFWPYWPVFTVVNRFWLPGHGFVPPGPCFFFFMAIVILFALVKIFNVSHMRDFFQWIWCLTIPHCGGEGPFHCISQKKHSWSLNIDSHGKGLNKTYPTIGLNSGLYDEKIPHMGDTNSLDRWG